MTVEELTHKSGQKIKQQHPAGEAGQPGVTREDINIFMRSETDIVVYIVRGVQLCLDLDSELGCVSGGCPAIF